MINEHLSRVIMSHGGKRTGSGRPKGSNLYGEPTRPIRVPISKMDEIKAFLSSKSQSFNVPLFSSSVRAGLPTSADDYIERYIDLNEHIISDAAASFLVRASGDSMINAGINDGDLLVVDKSIPPVHGKIVIASLSGELTVKRLAINKSITQLVAENSNYAPIVIQDDHSFIIHGVVTFVIHATA